MLTVQIVSNFVVSQKKTLPFFIRISFLFSIVYIVILKCMIVVDSMLNADASALLAGEHSCKGSSA